MFKFKSIEDLTDEQFRRYQESKDDIFEKLCKRYNLSNDIVLKSAEDMALIRLSMSIS